MTLEKFSFRIRTRNGVVLDRLHIQAADQDEARAKLLRMYPHCEVLSASQENQAASQAGKSFEDIADLLNH